PDLKTSPYLPGAHACQSRYGANPSARPGESPSGRPAASIRLTSQFEDRFPPANSAALYNAAAPEFLWEPSGMPEIHYQWPAACLTTLRSFSLCPHRLAGAGSSAPRSTYLA